MKQERKDELAFQLLLKEWNENEQSIRSLSQQIATLEQNSGLEQVNQRMEEIKKEARDQWDACRSIDPRNGQAVCGLSKVFKGKSIRAFASRINKKRRILPSLRQRLISSIRKCIPLILRKRNLLKNLATV